MTRSKEKAEIITFAKISKKTFKIHETCSRHISYTKKLVYKFDVPDDYDEEHQCRYEVKLFRSIEKQDKKHFAKIIKYGKGWVCQERIYFNNKKVKKHHRNLINDLAEKYYLCDDVDGDYIRNWGLSVNGTVKIFDYGIFD